MADSVELLLIRHLPTAGNGLRKYVGWTDEPIVPVQITRSLGQPDIVYGSDLIRARQTAELLFPEARYHPDARFRESNFGEFEGKTYAQLETNRAYRQWVEDPRTVSPPGGESLQQVEKRVTEAFLELPPGTWVVTHGGPIRLLLARFAPEPRSFWDWDVPHGSCHRLRWHSSDAWKEGERCTSYSAEKRTANDSLSGNS